MERKLLVIVRCPSLILGLVASLVVMTTSGVANADTIYNFDPLVSTGVNEPISPISFQLTLADDFVPESFSRDCLPGGCIQTGSFADFSLNFFVGSERLGVLDDEEDTVFESTKGTIDGGSGTLMWDTSMNTVSLTFGNGLWNATVFSDNPALDEACGSVGCTASGTVAQVPEPAALWSLAVGLIGIATSRRMRNACAG